jgi:hypothetical protein
MSDNTPKINPADFDDLHHSSDKTFKTVFQVKATALEYLNVYCTDLVKHLDLTYFELDNTDFVSKEFSEYYSDVIYRTRLKVESSKRKRPVAVALLFEHKKSIRSYFLLFLQLLDYIIFIWKQDLANKRKPSLVIPLVVYQGKTGLKTKQFRDTFKSVPDELLRYLPNFEFHLTNVLPQPVEQILALDEKGLLRSLFLAFTFVEEREKASEHIVEAFKFYQYDETLFDFFHLFFIYVTREGYLSDAQIEEVMSYLAPVKQQKPLTNFQIWRQEGKVEGKAEGEINKAHKVVLRGRHYGMTMDDLVNLSELSVDAVENLFAGYDAVLKCWQTGAIDNCQTDYLSEEEVIYVLDLFKKSEVAAQNN